MWLLWVGVAMVALYALSVYLDRRAKRLGKRRWSKRRRAGALRRVGRVNAMNSPISYLTDTKDVGDAYHLDDERHPARPEDHPRRGL
jgi:hypothetical protein